VLTAVRAEKMFNDNILYIYIYIFIYIFYICRTDSRCVAAQESLRRDKKRPECTRTTQRKLTSRILDKENSSHCEGEQGVGETLHHCPLPSFETFQHILSSSTFAHYSARVTADPPREYTSECSSVYYLWVAYEVTNIFFMLFAYKIFSKSYLGICVLCITILFRHVNVKLSP
jgi:hypothetical protein